MKPSPAPGAPVVPSPKPSALTTLLLCAVALTGFAANSLLARGALGAQAIDAASYTILRLASGAAMLVLLVALSGQPSMPAADMVSGWRRSPWMGAISLAAYAAAFSFSYLRIGAALGALVLFPTVKLALLGEGHIRGERPRTREWVGAGLGLAGLVVLTAPGLDRPDLLGVALMVLAGLAWAAYTVAGQRVVNPLVATRDNFFLASVAATPLLVPALLGGRVTGTGTALAVVSGAIASALSYAVWYRVVPRLSGMQLGLAQLSVPVLAGLGAAIVLGETITGRLLVAAALITTGVIVAVMRGAQR